MQLQLITLYFLDKLDVSPVNSHACLHKCSCVLFFSVQLVICRFRIKHFFVFTGSIARSANLPVFNLLKRPILRFFTPKGRHVAPMGVKFGMDAKFHPHWCSDKGVGPPKLKFLLRFDRNVEYKRPAGAYPLRNDHKICRVCTSF